MELIVKDCLLKRKVMGILPVSWEVEDSVLVGPYICKFDFQQTKVLLYNAGPEQTIAKIGEYQTSFLKPFVGSIKGDDWSLQTQLCKFGASMKLVLEIGGKTILKEVGLANDTVQFLPYFLVKSCFFSEKLIVEFESENEYAFAVSTVISTIIYKYRFHYLKQIYTG